MTKKHYTLIAEAIRNAMKDSFFTLVSSDEDKDIAKNYVLETLTNVIFQMSLTFEQDNPNFDRRKFADACMISKN
jgi:hypothetical protein